MKINVLIVDDNVERGEKAGRFMADGLRRQMVGWELHVHVRNEEDGRVGRDTSFAKYRP